MHPIQLDDQLFQQAQRRATEAGFESVDEYVADVLQHELEDGENLDRFFTPERLALIDQAAADVAAGHYFTMEQVRESLGQTRDAWRRDRADGK